MTESLRLRSMLAMGVSAAAIMAVAAPAFAQDKPDNAPTVGELIVTAQKREEAIQDVPIAVSAFSQDSLAKQKIDGGPNLVTAIPNVNFSKGNFTGYNFQIRGIGSKLVAASGDAGTGIHLNNAPLTSNNLFEAEFFDVERVEVLRGPQGTLYGRNATGGVVNVITAKPTDHFEAFIKGEYGNYNTYKLQGMVNIPMGDMFALRAAAAMTKRDGFGTNLTTGNDVDNRDLWNTRVTLAFNPTDSFRTTLMWDHFEEDDRRSRIGKQLCTKDVSPANIGGVNYSGVSPIATIQAGLFNQGCNDTPVDSAGILGTPDSRATLGGLFGALTGLTNGDAYAGMMQDPDIRNIQSSFDPVYRAKTDIVEFNLSWDLTDELQFTALTAYSKNELYTRQDYNRIVPNSTFNTSPNPVNAFAAVPGYAAIYASLFPGGVVNDPQLGPLNKFSTADISGGGSTQWSQEVRLQSSFDGPINFSVGGIYLDYKNDGDYYVMGNTLTAYAQLNNLLATGSANCAATNPACIYVDPNKDPDRSGHNYYDNTGAYHLKSRALFGEVYWNLTDTVKVTGGLRWTHDRKLVENRPVVLGAVGSGIPLSTTAPILTADFQEVTGRLGVDWKITPDNLLYGGYSRGYKAGGVNPACSATPGLICPPATFEPEFVDAFEIGSKNTFFDGSLQLNLTAFYYNYKGYQVSKIVNRTSVNENIDAKIKGLELESVWAPIQDLRLNMNVGYLDTEISSGNSIDTFNRTGGNAGLTLVKSSAASNCVVETSNAALALTVSNGSNNPFQLLGLCTIATPLTAAELVNPPTLGGTNAVAVGRNAFGGLISDGVVTDLKGKELPNAPHYTFSFGAQYTWHIGSWDATLRGDYYKQTDSFSRVYNTAADKLDGWQNLNATFTFAQTDAGLAFSIYGKNLTDEEVLTDTYLTDDSSGLFRNGFYGEPRTYGVAVSYKW